jgi:hypothetical protein
MADWKYGCSECKFYQESETKIKYFVGYECPKCKNGYVIELSEQNNKVPFAIVKSEPKTVGMLAKRNTDKMSKGEVAEKLYKDKWVRQPSELAMEVTGGKPLKRKPRTPWYRDGSVRAKGLEKQDKPLDITQIKNPEKYIMTGDKN